MVVEFSNAEGKISYNIDKIYQAEYEKELKEIASAAEAQKQGNQSTQSGVKKRSTKRRANMQKSDSTGWKNDILPNQRLDEILPDICLNQLTSAPFGKLLSRLKRDVISNTYEQMFSEKEIKNVFLFENYQMLAQGSEDLKDESPEDEDQEDAKMEEDKENPTEERKRGRKKKNKIKKAKITDKFDIGGEEEMNQALNEFFALLNKNSGMNAYDFCLQMVEFVLSNKHHCQYLIYTPNSLSFLSIFQKVYISLYNWEDNIPLESLLFIAEIMCKSQESYTGYDCVVNTILTKVATFNTHLLEDEIKDDKMKARICFIIMHFYKDIESNKINAVEIIERAQELLDRIYDTPLSKQPLGQSEPQEEQEKQSIILPWVSFEEWITKEKLDSY